MSITNISRAAAAAAILFMLIMSPPAMRNADASYTPVQISLFDPLQVFPGSWRVILVRLNIIYGYNDMVVGFDAGTVNQAGYLYGIQCGLMNMVKLASGASDHMNSGGIQAGFINFDICTFNGIQGGVFNLSSRFTGLQAGVFNANFGMTGIQAGAFNYSTDVAGVQAGVLNFSVHESGGWVSFGSGDLRGLQAAAVMNWAYELRGIQLCAFINGSHYCPGGVQVGLINYAEQFRGVQIGLINYAVRMSGVQIGLVNIIREGAVPFLPLFNASTTFEY